MLVLINPFHQEKYEISNSGELIPFLKDKNPTLLRSFKEQISKVYPNIIINGIGSSLKLKIRDN